MMKKWPDSLMETVCRLSMLLLQLLLILKASLDWKETSWQLWNGLWMKKTSCCCFPLALRRVWCSRWCSWFCRNSSWWISCHFTMAKITETAGPLKIDPICNPDHLFYSVQPGINWTGKTWTESVLYNSIRFKKES